MRWVDDAKRIHATVMASVGVVAGAVAGALMGATDGAGPVGGAAGASWGRVRVGASVLPWAIPLPRPITVLVVDGGTWAAREAAV